MNGPISSTVTGGMPSGFLAEVGAAALGLAEAAAAEAEPAAGFSSPQAAKLKTKPVTRTVTRMRGV
jgi:hypothetical protein